MNLQPDTRGINPELDLTLERVIRAPRDVVWRTWATPALLAQWWVPAPLLCTVDQLDVRPGGAFVTQISEDGVAFRPHTDDVFLVVEEGKRLVFTNAVDSDWRPAKPAPISMAAEVLFSDHPDGTEYRIIVRHVDPAACARHKELGFFEGWGSVADALAALAESQVTN